MESNTLAKVGIGCAIGCAVLALLGVLGGVAFFQWLPGGPEEVEVRVSPPVEVGYGESFDLEVVIRNMADRPRTLDSIDVSDSYLDGLAIERMEPASSGSMEIPVVDMRSFTFGREIPAGGTETVHFALKAVHEGDFSGNLDVCIDSGASCITSLVRTVVRPAPSGAETP